MATVIGVRFKNSGKTYSFDPDGQILNVGDKVIVETAQGIEMGEVVFGNREMSEEQLNSPLKPIVRIASMEDIQKANDNIKKQEEAMKICQRKIVEHNLDMKLTEVEYSFDGSKILFYFTADGRVDFRELVKDLASTFHTRIELRQIGVRNEAKMLGGLGICGQPFCCKQFLPDFEPVSIKMAKEQGLSLNPTKISGCCGRLMCCLKYEQDTYEELMKLTPKIGSYVKTEQGNGTVVESNLITGKLKVRMQKNPDAIPTTCHRDDVKVLQEGRGKVSSANRMNEQEAELSKLSEEE
ncbi:MAG: stage 0 sporulation family protein [Clostridia bacterium]|nr:stage 0 sporulation family protein [Clostridia bacterium]